METRRVSDTWERGNPYERYVGRWSRQLAPRFLSWLALPRGRRWLDVGCGTGALSAAILEQCAPASLAGVDPSPGFLDSAKQNLAGRAALHQGSAESIPLGNASVDAVVSGLVLNFAKDPRAALAEMRRVVAPGGCIAAYVWDYAGKMELMRYFWDAAVSLDAKALDLDEGRRFPVCAPGPLAELFGDGGLPEVQVRAIDIPTRFRDFDDYWRPFLGGQAPAPGYCMSLSDERRAALRERIRSRLPVGPDGSITLVARAGAVRARKQES